MCNGHVFRNVVEDFGDVILFIAGQGFNVSWAMISFLCYIETGN